MKRTFMTLALSGVLCLILLSCIEKLGTQLPPLNTRRLKKKIQPPVDFNLLVLKYKKDHGYWPKSEMDLTSFNRIVVNKLYATGFNSWALGNFSDDTLYIHFIHEPVFENAHIGGIPIPGREVSITTRYIHSRGTIKTELD